ncbi:MAG TPA: hypothetical protein VL202_09195 [Pararhizobium sp.]|nr:hypothetical protein [Pararhizobium sp.]HTO31338.1 hypothetical protein [Pararhizobium sp.]
MAITMMIVSAVISIVFLVDFGKTILQLQHDRAAMKTSVQDTRGFSV